MIFGMCISVAGAVGGVPIDRSRRQLLSLNPSAYTVQEASWDQSSTNDALPISWIVDEAVEPFDFESHLPRLDVLELEGEGEVAERFQPDWTI